MPKTNGNCGKKAYPLCRNIRSVNICINWTNKSCWFWTGWTHKDWESWAVSLQTLSVIFERMWWLQGHEDWKKGKCYFEEGKEWESGEPKTHKFHFNSWEGRAANPPGKHSEANILRAGRRLTVFYDEMTDCLSRWKSSGCLSWL